jgi:hypothetical protein
VQSTISNVRTRHKLETNFDIFITIPPLSFIFWKQWKTEADPRGGQKEHMEDGTFLKSLKFNPSPSGFLLKE